MKRGHSLPCGCKYSEKQVKQLRPFRNDQRDVYIGGPLALDMRCVPFAALVEGRIVNGGLDL